MKLIKSNIELIEADDYTKMIELAGRTCYKSEDKITDDSAKEFVDRMIKSKHGAMLEHGTVYLRVPHNDVNYHFYLNKYEKNPYSRCTYGLTLNGAPVGDICITTNYRMLVENGWLDDLKYQCDPTQSHAKRIAVKFICDRAISHQLVRHRKFSFAQESQRYCNYGKDKFNNEITFIEPHWWTEDTQSREIYSCAWKVAEEAYIKLTAGGVKPEYARAVLPNATKTEIVMTGFISDWINFLKLRSPKAGATGVYPDMAVLADKLYDLFKRRGYLEAI